MAQGDGCIRERDREHSKAGRSRSARKGGIRNTMGKPDGPRDPTGAGMLAPNTSALSVMGRRIVAVGFVMPALLRTSTCANVFRPIRA